MKLFKTILVLLLFLSANASLCFAQGRAFQRDRAINDALDRVERKQTSSTSSRDNRSTLTSRPEVVQNQRKLPPLRDVSISRHKQALDYSLRDQNPNANKPLQLNGSVSAGMRIDEIFWNITGLNGGAPNIATEFDWSKLKSFQIKTNGEAVFNDKYVVDGEFAYANIYSGDNTVSVFGGSGKTNEQDRTENSGDEGSLWNVQGGGGYRMYLGSLNTFLNDGFREIFDLNNTWLTLLGGYSFRKQNLNITNGVQTIDATETFPLAPFNGLDSPFESKWYGPYAGLMLKREHQKLSGALRVEYHRSEYEGEGTLNLNPLFAQPKSYEQEADGYGLIFNVDLAYQLTDSFRFDLNGGYQNWEIQGGDHTIFLANGSTQNHDLNEVSWQTYALMLGGTYNFR